MTMNEITDQTRAPAADPAAARKPLIYRIWPQAIVGFGLGLTVIWIFILGYGLVELVDELIDMAM
jgi:hypothetical protein